MLAESGLVEEFKCTKVRLEMTLSNPYFAQSAPTLVTGRKRTPRAAPQQVKSALEHQDVIGNVQHGRGGVGIGES